MLLKWTQMLQLLSICRNIKVLEAVLRVLLEMGARDSEEISVHMDTDAKGICFELDRDDFISKHPLFYVLFNR
jgi:hypothetical protein